MLQSNTVQENDDSNSIRQANILTAGLAGIIAGAAGVTALVLSDKILRRHIMQRTQSLKNNLIDWSSEKLHILDLQQIHDQDIVSEENDIIRKQPEIESKN